jgi:hypothetical protein
VVASAGPNWLGGPQHFVVGAIAAATLYAVARSRRVRMPRWLALILAISLVCTAELILELFEYPLLYSDRFHHSAYWDTLADMANSIVGAVAGALVAAATGVLVARRRV